MKKQFLSVLAAATVSMTAMAQAFIPNAGFETWGTTVGEDQQPTGWISYNIFTFAPFETSGANPTSVTQAGAPDNYQGTYSAKITTVTLVSNPDAATVPGTAGILLTGGIQFSSPYMRPGYATQQRPVSFSYAAKYTPVNGDTAYCLVALTKWHQSTMTRDTIAIGYDYMFAATSTYSVRTITLTYLQADSIPDSCLVAFSSSGNYTPQAGSALYVDALAFTGYVGVEEQSLYNGVDVYPNPSSDRTFFDVVDENAAIVVVYDMTGREVKRADVLNKKATINSYELSTGAYTYAILSKDGETMARGKFSVAE